MTPSPYHAGELLVQQRLGEQHIAAGHAPAIRSTIPASVAAVLAQQPLVVISSLDAAGQVWSSLLQGTPGFAHSPASGQLALHAALLAKSASDILWSNLAGHSGVSLLFIDFHSLNPVYWKVFYVFCHTSNFLYSLTNYCCSIFNIISIYS